jgi:predicted nucleic acid-binding protein
MLPATRAPPILRRGAFTYAPPTLTLLQRAMDIDRQHADLGLGLVDASVVALAERLGVYRLATRDLRHFSAVRLGRGRGFDLVVRPRRPDRGGR